MLGLGLNMNSASTQEAGSVQRSSSTAWTITTVGSLTTPTASTSGGANAVSVYVYIDNANDWTGDASDYTISNFQVTNDTTGQTSSLSATLADTGLILTIRTMKLATVNVTSGSGISAAHNGTGNNSFTFSFDITQAGYETASLSKTVSLADVTK